MRVYEVISKAVETVKPGVHASEARMRMRQKQIHHLVVMKGSDDLVAQTWLTAPLVYSIVLPFVLLDAWVTLYQAICFRAWRIRRVRRRDYFAIDRHRLAYLNGLEKLNCLFCGYANGLVAYVREIAARTEQYWCPIRHARRVRGPHRRYRTFAAYGDAHGYHERLPSLRASLKRYTDDA